MTDLQPFLTKLISIAGLSGYEKPVSKLIEEAWTPLTDERKTSRLGSLHGLRRGSAPEPRPSILISAHMDAIGLMVTGLAEGFLHVTGIGGLDPRILPGQLVTIHGRQDLAGVVIQPPGHLLPNHLQEGVVPIEYLLVDTGRLSSEVERLVRVGDLVSYAQPALSMEGDTLAGHSLDNRASVAALTGCLEALQSRPHAWDVWAVASVQEEVTLGGAATSAFQLHPSLAVALDVTFATSPGSPGHRTYPLGKGPVLGWGPNIHPVLFRDFKELAERLEIPHAVEVMPRHSGTDAFAMQVATEGIPCMVVSIPLRYMHTPVEMVSMKDITRAGRLLAEFIAALDVNYLEKVTWED